MRELLGRTEYLDTKKSPTNMSTIVPIIDSETGRVYIIRNWLQETNIIDDLFNYLRNNYPFRHTQIKLFGKVYDSPRLVYFEGDDDVEYHTYSKVKHAVNNWSEIGLEIKDKVIDTIEEIEGKVIPFNSSIVQLYRDRNDYIGYHSDTEILKEHDNCVVGLSLGCTRRFYFKNKRTSKVIKTTVSNGDLIVMIGDIQDNYKHSIPKQANVTERISITYRVLPTTV